jgi:hypothetical protein
MEITKFKKLVRLLRTEKKYEKLLFIRNLDILGKGTKGETSEVSPKTDRNSRKKRHR